MFIKSTERLIPIGVNVLTLAVDDGYIYIDRGLYEQAVILTDRYSDNVEALLKAITNEDDTQVSETIEYLLDYLPNPINILSYFLTLVKETEDDQLDVVDAIGAIHVMSNTINFRNVLKVPKEVRASLSWSLSIREEYQLYWDKFFAEDCFLYKRLTDSLLGNIHYTNEYDSDYPILVADDEDDDYDNEDDPLGLGNISFDISVSDEELAAERSKYEDGPAKERVKEEIEPVETKRNMLSLGGII